MIKAILTLPFLVLFLSSCTTVPKAGKLYQSGTASWYGPGLHGRKTANGERFDMNKFTAAHRTLPFDSKVCVRSAVTDREVVVRINDRGPFAKGRIIDLSKAAASQLGMLQKGEVEVELYSAYCP